MNASTFIFGLIKKLIEIPNHSGFGQSLIQKKSQRGSKSSMKKTERGKRKVKTVLNIFLRIATKYTTNIQIQIFCCKRPNHYNEKLFVVLTIDLYMVIS